MGGLYIKLSRYYLCCKTTKVKKKNTLLKVFSKNKYYIRFVVY